MYSETTFPGISKNNCEPYQSGILDCLSCTLFLEVSAPARAVKISIAFLKCTYLARWTHPSVQRRIYPPNFQCSSLSVWATLHRDFDRSFFRFARTQAQDSDAFNHYQIRQIRVYAICRFHSAHIYGTVSAVTFWRPVHLIIINNFLSMSCFLACPLSIDHQKLKRKQNNR